MKKLFALFFTFFFLVSAQAKEGMWIPLLIQHYNESDMVNMGMKITAEDLYAANQPSIKDAICLFGGGCTAELISSQGLLLTNHHCGYGSIQKHSTLENDYLTDGFWAETFEDELPNPGLTATFIVRIEDVSEIVLKGIKDGIPEEKRANIVNDRIDSLVILAKKGDEGYDAVVKPFYFGNQYFLFVTQTFEDIRLVGAPPSSIGKFGFDTDNWMWPRHNADFSLFRIYAGPGNKPAGYSETNMPYKPKRHLTINIGGIEENDFSMVYGFPARTSEYLPSIAVEYIIDDKNPSRISMRDISLEIINDAMRLSKRVNIQYAAKQARISNAWKKWKGQTQGLIKTGAVQKKQALENKFMEKVNLMVDWKAKYGTILTEYEILYDSYMPLDISRDMLIELYYYGPEILRFVQRFKKLEEDELMTESQWKEMTEKLLPGIRAYFKDYDKDVDYNLFKAMMPAYIEHINTNLAPQSVLDMFGQGEKTTEKVSKQVYANTWFADSNKVKEFLRMDLAKARKALVSDPAFGISNDILKNYENNIKPRHTELSKTLDSLNRIYMEALLEVLPREKNYYPDANGTLRLTYGKVRSYEPVDGIVYKYYTTLDGVMQKRDTNSYEFQVPEKLVKLYESKNYGPYAREDGKMPVCYIATNHTSGGNSGSPALDANGYLVGLNFDRTWESTMSDIMYDPEICRNIMVDIRYVLFIIDKYARAERLIAEMDIVKK